MKDYYKPDSRWEFFGAKTVEHYLERYVVKGHFHKDVPEDILKDYETVEYLLSGAWFYYPMYDEGLKKLLGIFEMAVKFRCKQLGIELEYINKKGEKKDRTLSQLITILKKKESYKNLDFELEKARNVRNHFAHPENHSFFGTVIRSALPQVINTINYLFLDKSHFEKASSMLENIKEDSKLFKKGCFVLEYSGKNYLVTEVNFIEAWEINGDWQYFIYIHPVSNNISDELKNNSYTIPFYISAKNLTIFNEQIIAVDTSSNQTIKIYPTSKPENTLRVKKYFELYNNSKQEDINTYKMFLASELAKKHIDHRYKYYWNN